MITTQEYKISQGQYLAAMARWFGKGWLLTVTLLAVGCIVLGIVIDFRWIIVALMLVMLVFPMLAAILYFHYGLRPEGFVNTLPHTVSFAEEELHVKVYFKPFGEETAEDVEALDDVRELQREERDYSFKIVKPVRYVAGSTALSIPVGEPCRGVIIVPYSAIGSAARLKEVVAYLV